MKFNLNEKDKQIVEKANVCGKIKNVIYFTENLREYAIVVNKISGLYAVRLINYEYTGNEIKLKTFKRFPDLTGFYKSKEEANEGAKEIQKSQELISQCIYEFETHEDNTENLLIIGRTGSGKSTMANVISGSKDFEENAAYNKAKNFQIGDFELEETKYRVIDTIGIGDIQLSQKDVLYNIGEAIHSMEKGIKQVFVIVGGKFTKEELESFNILKKVIFGTGILNYTTIVRTNFDNFELPEECDNDKKTLKEQSPKIAKLIDSCNGFIYVNNPPLNNISRLEVNERDRKISRERLLIYLKTLEGNFKVEEDWDTVCVRINDFVNARKRGEHKVVRFARELKKKVITKELKKEVAEEIRVRFNELSVQEPETEFQASLELPTGRAGLTVKRKGACCLIL